MDPSHVDLREKSTQIATHPSANTHEEIPAVQLKSSSESAAAVAKSAPLAPSPASAIHSFRASPSAEREPIVTS